MVLATISMTGRISVLAQARIRYAVLRLMLKYAVRASDLDCYLIGMSHVECSKKKKKSQLHLRHEDLLKE